MLANRLRAKGVPESNILSKKLDGFDVPLEPTSAWLDDLLRHALKARDQANPFYVFLDEVQEAPGWEKVVRRLHTEPATDIFLAGSNTFLPSDLATYLSGRYIEIPVWPLPFPKYLDFSQATGSGASEVDFVASRRSERLYVQVSNSIGEGQTPSLDKQTGLLCMKSPASSACHRENSMKLS